MDIVMEDNEYSGTITVGKGSYNIPGWPGGWVKMTVDLKNKTVNFKVVDGPDA